MSPVGKVSLESFLSFGRGFDSHRPLHKSLLMQLALLASTPENSL